MNKLFRFFHGTMNSAKTAEMLMRNYSLNSNGLCVALFKSAIDNRSGETKIASRIGLEAVADGVIKEDTDVNVLLKNFIASKGTPDIILVDEAQFLSSKQIEQLRSIVSIKGIPVDCYGLRTDANSYLFEGSKRLFELCDANISFENHCDCGELAIINARVDENGFVVTPNKVIDIGGNEKYKPMCYKCWITGGKS